MSDTINISSFPGDKYEALAMLHVQSQDVSGFSPEQLLDAYQESYDRIRSHAKAKHAERKNARVAYQRFANVAHGYGVI